MGSCREDAAKLQAFGCYEQTSKGIKKKRDAEFTLHWLLDVCDVVPDRRESRHFAKYAFNLFLSAAASAAGLDTCLSCRKSMIAR